MTRFWVWLWYQNHIYCSHPASVSVSIQEYFVPWLAVYCWVVRCFLAVLYNVNLFSLIRISSEFINYIFCLKTYPIAVISRFIKACYCLNCAFMQMHSSHSSETSAVIEYTTLQVTGSVTTSVSAVPVHTIEARTNCLSFLLLVRI